MEYNILTVVHREIAENIREIYPYYRRNGWDYLQFIACLDPLGEPRGCRPYSLLPETYGRFLSDLFDLWYEEWKQGYAPFIRQFENYVGILLGIPPESCEQRGTCTVQHVVEADGSVYPCDFYVLDGYCAGNLNRENFSEIHERIRTSEFARTSANQTEECRRCSWFPLCRGGCRRHREQPGTPFGLNYFCKSYQMFFSACIRDLERLAAVTSGVF